MYVFAFLQTNMAKNQKSWVDSRIAKHRLDQSQRKDTLGKAFFHNKLSESNPKR